MWHDQGHLRLIAGTVNMIRTFRNADVPALADVWVESWSRFGAPPRVTTPMIEQAVLSRTFFDPATLWVSESETGVDGWAHVAIDPQRPDTATLCALCWRPGAETVGRPLLAAALEALPSGSSQRTQAGVIRDDRFGYAGLDPLGHGFGLPDEDLEIAGLLGQFGFAPEQAAVQMAVSTRNYRPPVSREALQLRRSTRVSAVSQPPTDLRRASAMAHLDVTCQQLLGRGGESLAQVGLWRSDPEAEVMPSHQAILDLSVIQQPDRLQPQESFLIASLLQSLSQHGDLLVQTVIEPQQTVLREQLEKLLFEPRQQGHCWIKQG